LAVVAVGNPGERSTRLAESTERICSVPLSGGRQRGSVSKSKNVVKPRQGRERLGDGPKMETYMPPLGLGGKVDAVRAAAGQGRAGGRRADRAADNS
jgi:hypothetical protein